MQLGGWGSLGTLGFCPSRRSSSMARPEGSVSGASFILAKTLQELISAFWILQGVSEQPFRLKIVREKKSLKSNQNICLKSIIITCGGFNAHLWFNIILALRPKYIILSTFIAQSLLTWNYFMYKYTSFRKLPHSHQQDSCNGNEVFRGIRRKVGNKIFLAMGFPHLFLSHLSQPLRDRAQFEIAAVDHYLFPFPGEMVKKEPKLGQFRFQSDPRLRNYLYLTLYPNGQHRFFFNYYYF